MKTIILTLSAILVASLASSCVSTGLKKGLQTKQYDERGRLVKEVNPDGNYTTYHYDGTSPDDVVEKEKLNLSQPLKKITKPFKDFAEATKPNPNVGSHTWKPRIP